MNIHASQLARVMACPGSLFFKDLPPQETNEAAKEGTAAAEYLEKFLTGQRIDTHASNGVAFNDDMKFYAKEVADEILPMAKNGVTCEQQVDWQVTSTTTLKGRYDVSYVNNETLIVGDYKYGFGLVEVEYNWQLIAYAIGEVIRLNRSFENIILEIYQPRAHHEDGPFRNWLISYSTLLEYKSKIEEHVTNIENGLQDLTTGPHCRYCPAATACPAFNKAYHRGVEVTQSFVQDNLDENELSYQLDLVARIEEIVKTRKQSLEQLAVHRIREGQIIPNYISEDRYGHRTWKDNINPEAIKLMTGADITETVLLSPAKAEKRGVPKKLMKTLVKRPHLGQKLKRKDMSKVGNKIFGDPNG